MAKNLEIIAPVKGKGDFPAVESENVGVGEKRLNTVIEEINAAAQSTATEVETEKVNIQTNSEAIEEIRSELSAAETAISGKASQEEVNTIKSDVAGKASTEAVSQLQTEMDVQKARMDQLVEDPEVGVDEIADARIDNTGKTYDNLGDHIRGTETSLKETIGTISDDIEKSNTYVYDAFSGKNIEFGYDFDTNASQLWEKGLINTGGVNTDNTATIRTIDFIPQKSEIIMKTISGYQYRVCKYNVDGSFVECSDWLTTVYNLDSNYKYRVTIRNVSGGTAELENYNVLGFFFNKHVVENTQTIQTVPYGYQENKNNKGLYWVNGYIDASSGNIVGNAKVLTTSEKFTGKIISVNTKKYEFCLGTYKSTGEFIGRTGWKNGGSIILEAEYQYRISLRSTEGFDMSDKMDLSFVSIFDGKKLPMSIYSGKKLSILGDSISTFRDIIPTEHYYYPTPNAPDVQRKEDCWWYKLMTALDMELCVNNSYSGSCVSNNGGAPQASGYIRADQLHTPTTHPDVIIVAMGVNDFLQNVSLGDYNGHTDFPTDPASNFRAAYAMMLKKMLETYPRTEIWCATILSCERYGEVEFPEKGNAGTLLKEWNDAIRDLAALFGVRVLDRDKCGINYQNLNLYMGDWNVMGSGTGLHPNELGHSMIANSDISQMDNYVRIRF